MYLCNPKIVINSVRYVCIVKLTWIMLPLYLTSFMNSPELRIVTPEVTNVT